MKALRNLLPALVCAVPLAGQPSADQVLEKYVQAIGGKAAYEKVTTRAMKGTVEMPDDNVSGPAELIAKAPDRFRLTMDIPGYGVVESVFQGDQGWEKNPDSGVHAMSKGDLEIARRDHNFYRETHLKELYPTLGTPAQEQLEGHAVYVIEATPAGGAAEKLYFDAESGLLVKHDFERTTLEDGIVHYEMFYRDYREVDGLKLPATLEQRSPDYTMIWKFTEIKNDAPVEDAAFAKPEK